jgi:hypothetical protein
MGAGKIAGDSNENRLCSLALCSDRGRKPAGANQAAAKMPAEEIESGRQCKPNENQVTAEREPGSASRTSERAPDSGKIRPLHRPKPVEQRPDD